MSAKILTISDDSFKADVIDSDTPVLLDFWAEWCGPCRALAPVLEDIATTYEGRLTIAKINVDENTKTAQKYGIRAIPTLILFKDGNVVSTETGSKTKSELVAFLDSNI